MAREFTQNIEIKMTPKEKKDTWESISLRTFLLEEKTLVRKPILSRLNYRGLLPAIKLQNTFFHKRKYAFGVIAGTLIVSGSISAFAQGALPGDLLYPVKTKVNEKLEVVLAITPEEKAETEAIQATKRLEEVEKLALKGKLTPVLVKEIGDDFDSHVRNFEKYLMQLENGSNFSSVAKIGTFFQTRIAVHIALLKKEGGNSTKTNSFDNAVLNTAEDTMDSHLTKTIEKKVLSAIVPTVIITKKAFLRISNHEQKEVVVYKNIRNQHIVPMNIDIKEVKNYIKMLRDDAKIPIQTNENVPTPLIATFVK